MKFNYLFYTLIFLAALTGCTECEECKDLYYEPGFKVTFYKDSTDRKALKLKDTLAVNILSFNGQSDIPKIINLGKANYVFPIPMNSPDTTTLYIIEFQKIGNDTILKDSFSLKYSLEQYFYNDRFLLRPVAIELTEEDIIDDVLTCVNCQNASAQITIYE
ncbi:MAG TPA: hypothetical protein VD908_14520 [Cytophagales bacterium]|nr:hypothetical protein [Cytophagales bacterium]